MSQGRLGIHARVLWDVTGVLAGTRCLFSVCLNSKKAANGLKLVPCSLWLPHFGKTCCILSPFSEQQSLCLLPAYVSPASLASLFHIDRDPRGANWCPFIVDRGSATSFFSGTLNFLEFITQNKLFLTLLSSNPFLILQSHDLQKLVMYITIPFEKILFLSL